MLDRRALLRGGALVAGGAAAASVAAPAVAAGTPASAAYAGRHRDDHTIGSVGVHWRVSTPERVVALTFDDGPTARYTSAVLDALAAQRARATFFVVGQRVSARPDLARRLVDAGHEVGNHTWSHPDLSTLDEAGVVHQLTRTHEAVQRATGRAPAVMRPPFGRLAGSTLLAAGQLGYPVVLWSMELHERSLTSAENATHITAAATAGSVVLAHDGGPGPHGVGVAALPALLAGLSARGFRFVTVSELLALAAQ